MTRSNVPVFSAMVYPIDGREYGSLAPACCPLSPEKVAHPQCLENWEVRQFLILRAAQKPGQPENMCEHQPQPICCYKLWPSLWEKKESDRV